MVLDKAGIPKKMGEFTLIRQIGQGGMGVVYEAHQTTLNRTVALKVLSSKFTRNTEFIKRFEREARITANLQHQNIVRVFDFGREGTTCYLVMELIDGMPLSELLSRQGSLDIDRSLHILREIANGLSATHAKGVLHRDIKPHNIMVSRDGKVKVMDFGLAKPDDSTTQMTQTGANLGTPAYMAPEQCRAQTVSVQSDIYSLGVVLFELLTGRTPFDADNYLALMYQIVEEPFPAPSSIVNTLSPSIDIFLGKMVAKDPADRYSSIDSLISDLKVIQSDTNTKLTSSKSFSDLVAPIKESNGDVENIIFDNSLIEDLVSPTKSSFAPLKVTRTFTIPKWVWKTVLGIIVLCCMILIPILLSQFFPEQPLEILSEPEFNISANDIVGQVGKRYIYDYNDGKQRKMEWTNEFQENGTSYYHSKVEYWVTDIEYYLHLDYAIQDESVLAFFTVGDEYPANKWDCPIEDGKNWQADIYINGLQAAAPDIETTYYRSDEETVTVPAGTYRAIRVIASQNYPPDIADQTASVYWYSPDVGMVKFRMMNGTQLVPGGPYVYTAELNRVEEF